MLMNVFEAVKDRLSTREAAEYYGLKINRNGMACCPFHNDKNPSMKVDHRYHCFASTCFPSANLFPLFHAGLPLLFGGFPLLVMDILLRVSSVVGSLPATKPTGHSC